MKVLKQNIYLDIMRETFQQFVTSFTTLRTMTLLKLEDCKKTLKEPHKEMQKIYDEAYKSAMLIKNSGIQNVRNRLQHEATMLKQRNEATDTLKELQKLNAFFNFRDKLTAMQTVNIETLVDETELTETQLDQIKAELTTRLKTAETEEIRYQHDELLMKIALNDTTPLKQLEKALNELTRIENDTNLFPYLPAHLAVQTSFIPELLGQNMITDEYYSKSDSAPLTVGNDNKADRTAIIYDVNSSDALARSVINAKRSR